MNTDNQLQTVQDVVCPKCFKPLVAPTLVNKGTDNYGRQLRTYFGWCFECDLGAEVIQFFRDQRWLIHKYQHYDLIAEYKQCKPSGRWVTLNELPEPAPVITGPGGDFVQLHDIQCDTIKKAVGALDAVKKALMKLLT